MKQVSKVQTVPKCYRKAEKNFPHNVRLKKGLFEHHDP